MQTGSKSITESGTVNAQTNLDNIKLFYELDTTPPYDGASESYAGTESQFGSTDTEGFSAANGTSSFTGSVGISTTAAMVVYVVFDVGAGAANGETVEISINNPSTDVTVSAGTVEPATAVAISGTTTLSTPANLDQIHYRWRNDDGGEQGSANWWNTSYLYRTKVTFGTSHSLLPLYYTVTATMDTRPANTNVELTTGNDVRVVWQPTAGGPVELNRIGDTWNSATTNIDFRLQSEIGANLNEDPDGSYYIYYGNVAAGTPPTNEMNVYYFADFSLEQIAQ